MTTHTIQAHYQAVHKVLAAATEARLGNRCEYTQGFNLSGQVKPNTQQCMKCFSLNANLETRTEKKQRLL